MLKFDVDVAGEPDPKVSWQYKDAKITNDRIKIDFDDHQTTFYLKQAKRSDTGIYKITAKNDSGTDTAELDLIVVGK